MTNIAFQLFSARNTEIEKALGIVAEAGFSSVEAYGDNFKDVELFRTALKNEGLSLASAHVSLDELENNLSTNVERLASFGCTHIVCPYLLPDNRPTSREGWTELAKRLEQINSNLQSHDCTFAWHNHDFEFVANDDDSVPMQILLEQAPGMSLELDIGWVVRVGADPASWIKQHGARVSAFHFKDLVAAGSNPTEDDWADVGYGVVDWRALLDDIKSVKTNLYIVEHDNPADLKRFAENSISTIKAWRLS